LGMGGCPYLRDPVVGDALARVSMGGRQVEAVI
jgi:hypothetical protein